MDTLIAWITLAGFLIYPGIMAWGSIYVARKQFSEPRTKPLWGKWLGLLILPPVLWLLFLSMLPLPTFEGLCYGWLDAPDEPCSLFEFWQLNLFWTIAISWLHILAGLGVFLCVAAFYFWQSRRKTKQNSR